MRSTPSSAWPTWQSRNPSGKGSVSSFRRLCGRKLPSSVETLAGRSGPFVITADRAFVKSLSEPELEAAIAHELGHVWIYTHYPYVQTERLANDIALRVTSAEILAPVYEKVWQRTGARGNLAEYISLEPKQQR